MTIEELSKLSDEDLRLECASLCGWRKMTKEEFKLHGVDWINDLRHEVASHYDLPMYPQNLNAMHEAEELLERNDEARAEYEDILDRMGRYRASARQRCIAFISVMQSA